MPARSAGLLIHRRSDSGIEVFLVHPGGPFWAKKDLGAWSIPKGQYGDDEEPFSAAKREFEEETGFVPQGQFIELGEVKQPGGKVVIAWAVEQEFDPEQLRSNTLRMEWPPRSGRQIEVPEVDRACWFTVADARKKLLSGQLPFLDKLLAHLTPSG
jgi:predicted NUDIX family NTP pyrophosphohydrolase